MYESGKARIIIKIIFTLAVPFVSMIYFMLMVALFLNIGIKLHAILEGIVVFIVPAFLISVIWIEKRKRLIKFWGSFTAVFLVTVGINLLWSGF